MHTVISMGKALLTARTVRPFNHLWRLKTVYDLSNFCNRHSVRVAGLRAINDNIKTHVMPLIEGICRRMTDMSATRVAIDGSHEQAHLSARHEVDHNNYMQAWQDLSTLTALSVFDQEPATKQVSECYTTWQHHATLCRSHDKQPEFHVPFIYTQWHINRLHRLIAVLYRYTGKNYNDLLQLMLDNDCALRNDISNESAPGRTTMLDLLSYQISCCVDVTMKRLYGQCVKHNYQEMECSSRHPAGPGEPHACPIGGTCYGCNCHPKAQSQTALYVERMFQHLDKYQLDFGLDYSDSRHFPPMSYCGSTVQHQNHNSRKRFAVRSGNTQASMANIDLNTIPGIEPLLNGSSTQHQPNPLFFNYLRHTQRN
jgi:hypothetical protein